MQDVSKEVRFEIVDGCWMGEEEWWGGLLADGIRSAGLVTRGGSTVQRTRSVGLTSSATPIEQIAQS